LAKLTVKIRRRDGTSEEVTLAEAILVYERRRDASSDARDREHCQRRIDQLQARWKQAVHGKVDRVDEESRVVRPPVKPSEAPTRGRVPSSDAPTRKRTRRS
jgi:hypothetical protein